LRQKGTKGNMGNISNIGNITLLRKSATQILLSNTENNENKGNIGLQSIHKNLFSSGKVRQMGTECDKKVPKEIWGISEIKEIQYCEYLK
jgi:hypothetical protein